MQAVMMQWLSRGRYANAKTPLNACSSYIIHSWERRSVVVLARFLLFVLLLLLFALAVALLLLELLLPELVDGVAVDVGEDNLEDVRVPLDGLAFDAFFDILGIVSMYSDEMYQENIPLGAPANRSCCLVGR
jgi:hypothetical protein